MKHYVFFILICIAFCSTAVAQDSDQELVKKTVSYYLEGGTNNDFETLKKAFHENATMKFVTTDGYREVNAIEFFKKAIKAGPKQDRKTSIISIDVTGTAATAKLKIEYSTFNFIDYMNLLKINGEWKVVSKIFFRQNTK